MSASCGRRTAGASVRTAVVSVEPIRAIVSAVAGPQWQVTSLVGPGADPESFDPSVNAVRRAAEAQALFTTGFLPFEQTVIGRIADHDTKVVSVSDGIELIEGSHGGEAVDPHVWGSLRNAQVIARNAASAFGSIDPDHASDYTQRADSLMAVYIRADQRIDSMLRRVPVRAFLIRHPSLTYFARDYLLEQIAVGADNKDLSVAAVRRAVEDAGAAGAAVYFVESDGELERASALASELEIPTVLVNPMDADIVGQLTGAAAAISAGRARPMIR